MKQALILYSILTLISLFGFSSHAVVDLTGRTYPHTRCVMSHMPVDDGFQVLVTDLGNQQSRLDVYQITIAGPQQLAQRTVITKRSQNPRGVITYQGDGVKLVTEDTRSGMVGLLQIRIASTDKVMEKELSCEALVHVMADDSQSL